VENGPIEPREHDWDAALDYLKASQDPSVWDTAFAFAQHRAQAEAANRDLLNLARQYLSDLKRPPTGDSLQRRIEQAERVIAKAGGA